MAPRSSQPISSVRATPELALVVRPGDDPRTSTVIADGELDLASAEMLGATLWEQRRAGRQFVRIDLSGVTFIDATALGVVVGAHHAFLDCGGTLVLTGVGRRIQRLLRITGLDDLLLVAGTRAEYHPAADAPQSNLRPAPWQAKRRIRQYLAAVWVLPGG